MTNTCFDRGRISNHKEVYPYRLKIIFNTYDQEIEDFCNKYFSNAWGVRFYNEEYKPLTTSRRVYYILCFTNEEDAILFKMSFSAEALTDDELTWDNNRHV